jgi:integrase
VSLWKRGNVYWSYVYVDGIRYAQSTGTNNRRQALIVEQHFKEELNLQRHQIVQPNPQMPFGELAARFLAEGNARPWHRERLKLLLPYWGEVPIGRIHKAMAEDYRRRRHAAKEVTDTTINRDLEALKHMLFWAVDQGLLIANPLSRVRLVRERRKPRPVLGVEEEQYLIAAAAEHLQILIVTALDTGMRRGELLHERWEHFDWNRNLLFVTHSKTAGGEAREIPLTERVHSVLYPRRQSAGLVFTFHENPIQQIKTAWKAAIRRAGIRYYRFHDLRHTFNTRLMEAGVMQEVRKSLMGHSSGEEVNSMYTHIELPVKREAIRKLEQWVHERQQELEQKGGSHASKETNGPGTAAVSTNQPSTTKAMGEKDPGRGRA